MTTHLPRALATMALRYLADDDGNHTDCDHDDGGGHGSSHGEFGVHIEYEDLYDAILFLVIIYVAGQLASRVLTMPSLVGEIVAGILLGQPLADYVPYKEAWVLLGEIGLVLLVLEAGIDIDVSTLKLIGTRGFLIAVVGSILPIGLGIVVALALMGTDDIKGSIAAGATFGPTSLGIALNILRSGGILNTPVGQLIVSAAVIDDMIALIVLSQLEALTGDIDVVGVLVPVISACAFLIIGGAIALFVVPGFMENYVLKCVEVESHGQISMVVMFSMLLVLMPATYYAKASYLMGAFVAGLAFCTSHELHVTFVRQFKRVMQWLMRIFFAASIGFQVPIKDFNDATVIWHGLVFTAALIGKLAVGFMVPNFTQSRNFTGFHLRDCLITGFSMAAEGEFAFVIAVYSVDQGLIDQDLYASVVLAVLLSTIIPPFALRFTISHYNKIAQEQVRKLASQEMERRHDLEVSEHGGDDREEQLKRSVFLCIQTQSEARWGLMNDLMGAMAKMGLDVIDHRAWHPRGITTTLVNEVYAKDLLQAPKGGGQAALDEHMQEITATLRAALKQEDAKVQVSRWYPGVVEEIIEKVDEQSKVTGRKSISLEQRLLTEAATKLDEKQKLQLNATKEKTVEEILSSMKKDGGGGGLLVDGGGGEQPEVTTPGGGEAAGDAPAPRRARRRRQKMRSTPVVGGGLFGETDESPQEEKVDDDELGKGHGRSGRPSSKKWKPDFDFGPRSGYRAEIVVDGDTYDVRVSAETLKALRTGFSGDMLDNRGVTVGGMSIQAGTGNVVDQLQGFVRNVGSLGHITEEAAEDGASETSSLDARHHHHHQHPGASKNDKSDNLPPV